MTALDGFSEDSITRRRFLRPLRADDVYSDDDRQGGGGGREEGGQTGQTRPERTRQRETGVQTAADRADQTERREFRQTRQRDGSSERAGKDGSWEVSHAGRGVEAGGVVVVEVGSDSPTVGTGIKQIQHKTMSEVQHNNARC